MAETAGCTEKSALLSFVTRNESDCADSFAGPARIPVAQATTVCAPASSASVRSGPRTNTGASFTGETVIANVCGALVSTPPPAVPPLSASATVTVAAPNTSAAGV